MQNKLTVNRINPDSDDAQKLTPSKCDVFYHKQRKKFS